MIILVDDNGAPNRVDEGESANITATFSFNDEQFNKAGLLSVTLTLYDKISNTVINDRENQDVLDANGSSVATDGTLTLELDADDNVIVSDTLESEDTEEHIARLVWTWSDGDSIRKGVEEMSFLVRKLSVPTNP